MIFPTIIAPLRNKYKQNTATHIGSRCKSKSYPDAFGVGKDRASPVTKKLEGVPRRPDVFRP